MSKLNFLRRFLNNDAYKDAKSTLPYPSISLTNTEGELYLKGITAQRTVILTSNAKDAVITVDGTDYTFSDGSLTLYLDEGSYSYVITKGSLADTDYLSVSPTSLSFAVAGESKTIDYTAYTTTYQDSMSGTLVVVDNMTKALNFTGTKVTKTPTWSDDASWLSNSDNVFTADPNSSTSSRNAVITGTVGTVSKTISVVQAGASTFTVTVAAESIDGSAITATVDGNNVPLSLTSSNYYTGSTQLPNGTYEVVITPSTYSNASITHDGSTIYLGSTAGSTNTAQYSSTLVESKSITTSVTVASKDVTVNVSKDSLYETSYPQAEASITAVASVVSQSFNSTTKLFTVTLSANTDYTATTVHATTIVYHTDKAIAPTVSVVQNAPATHTVTFLVNGPFATITDCGTVVINGETINLGDSANSEQVSASTSLANGTYSYTINPKTHYTLSDLTSPSSITVSSTGGDFEIDYNSTINTYDKQLTGTVTVNGSDETVEKDVEDLLTTTVADSIIPADSWVTYKSTVTAGTNGECIAYFTASPNSNSTSSITLTASTSSAFASSRLQDFSANDITITLDDDFNSTTLNIQTSQYPTGGDVVMSFSETTKGSTLTIPASTLASYSNLYFVAIGMSSDYGKSITVTAKATDRSTDVIFTLNSSARTVTDKTTINQSQQAITATTYSVSDVSSPEVEYTATSATITFRGHTISHFEDGSTAETVSSESQVVTFAPNYAITSTARTGSFTWQTETVNWTVNQNGNPDPIFTSYTVSDISSPTVDWDVTSTTITFTGHTILHYIDGSTKDTPSSESSAVTFEQNNTFNSVNRTGVFTWETEGVNWTVTQNPRTYYTFTITASDAMSYTISGDNGYSAMLEGTEYGTQWTSKEITLASRGSDGFAGLPDTNYIITFTGNNTVSSAVTEIEFTSSQYTFGTDGGEVAPQLRQTYSISGKTGSTAFVLNMNGKSQTLTVPVVTEVSYTDYASGTNALLSVSDSSWMSIYNAGNVLKVESGYDEVTGTITATSNYDSSKTATATVSRTAAETYTTIFSTNAPNGDVLIEEK